MSCPSADRWIAAQLLEVSVTERDALIRHGRQCSACRGELSLLTALGDTTSGPTGHIVEAALMETDARHRRWPVPFIAVASAVVLISVGWWVRADGPVARGSGTHSWQQRVGAEIRPVLEAARPVVAGSTHLLSTSWTVWYRNAESGRPLYLLAYILDSRGDVHWIAPAYVTAGVEPLPITIPVASGAQLLSESMTPEGLAAGQATLITVVSAAPASVVAIEHDPRFQQSPETTLTDAVVWRMAITVVK